MLPLHLGSSLMRSNKSNPPHCPPFGKLTSCCLNCRAVKKQMAEQQLRARQMVLQQQAASAVAAASKTQREVTAMCSLW